MTNQTTNIPALRFPEFKGGWEEMKLGEMLSFKNGINASKEQYGHGIKFINVLDIINNNFITHDRIIGSVNITEEKFEKNKVSYGDVLFQRSSETREEAGQANVYLDKEKAATFGGFVIRGKKLKEYNPVFINNLLKTASARKEITSRSGGSTRYNVGQETLSSVGVFSTKEKEQQKIANFLGAVDDKIQQFSEKHRLLSQYKKGVMQQIFSQQIRFKNDNGRLYPAWEEKQLREVAKFFSGGTPLTTDKSYYEGSIPFIKSGEIRADQTEQFISEAGLNNSSAKMVEKGDLLFALYGATSGEVAVAKISGAINQAILCIRTDEDRLFLYNFFSLKKEQILSKYLQGGQGNLSANIVKDLVVSLPSKEEQQKVANFLSQIDNKIEQVNQQLEQARAFKKGLLQQMFV